MRLQYAMTALALVSTPAVAEQSSSAELPLPVASAQPAPTAVLPANTEVLVSTNYEVTTKGERWKEGDTFDLAVVNDVTFGNYVIIPKGSRAVGRITWLTSKGAFGKSGKMDITVEYVEVAGRRIALTGNFRQEGEGNTVATVGGVVLAGVFAGFVTGKSGRIPQGRELMARTKSDLPLALPATAVAVVPLPVVPVGPTVTPAAPQVPATPAAVSPAAASGTTAQIIKASVDAK